jgi:hypothetical protein
MTGKIACICLLLAAGTAIARPVTIFFTGNELGEMKPCGCSVRQIGGLDRRNAIFSTEKLENRLIIDTGSLVFELSEQNQIKFNIIVQAFNQLGYDVVNLTEEDIIVARQAGLLDGLGSVFNCITAESPQDVVLPVKFTKRFRQDGFTLDVTVVAADTDEQILEAARSFAAIDPCTSAPFNILIVGRRESVSFAAGVKGVDCVIAPTKSDEWADWANTSVKSGSSRRGSRRGRVFLFRPLGSMMTFRSSRGLSSFTRITSG